MTRQYKKITSCNVAIKTALMAALAISAAIAQAKQFTVSAWRGETVAELVEDFAISSMDLSLLPEGVTGRMGTLCEVRYMTMPKSLQYLSSADRVEWDSDEMGPKVVELTVSPDAKAGEYDVGPMKLKIVDRVLPAPKDWKYYLDLWQHPWAVSRTADVRPFSWRHYRAMRPIWELLATAGQKSLTVSILDEPWDHQCFDAYHSMIKRTLGKDGKWTYDYSLFDEYVEFGRSCGIGPDISCYTMCPWGYIVRYTGPDGKTVAVEAKPGTKVFDDFWAPFLVDFAAHLKAKGWFKDTYIAMDERSPEDVLYIANFVQKYAPGMRIAMAGNRKPSDFKGITIDSYSQVLSHVTDDFLAECESRRAKGFVTTHYVCCAPVYPNTFMSSAAGEAFWNGVFPGFVGLDGFLRWAWNSWGEDAMKDASYWVWRAGDTFLVYPDGSPSWRFLDLRNGIVAAEKLRILKEQGLYAEEIAKLAKNFKAKEAVANKSNFKALRILTLNLVNR
jgi:hypothetical protein